MNHQDQSEILQASIESDSFKKELADIINRYSKENASNTPDFILANYVHTCLTAYEIAVNQRDSLRVPLLKINEPQTKEG